MHTIANSVKPNACGFICHVEIANIHSKNSFVLHIKVYRIDIENALACDLWPLVSISLFKQSFRVYNGE